MEANGLRCLVRMLGTDGSRNTTGSDCGRDAEGQTKTESILNILFLNNSGPFRRVPVSPVSECCLVGFTALVWLEKGCSWWQKPHGFYGVISELARHMQSSCIPI